MFGSYRSCRSWFWSTGWKKIQISPQLWAVPLCGLHKVAPVFPEVRGSQYGLQGTKSPLPAWAFHHPREMDSSILQIRKNRDPERFNNLSKVTQLVRGMPIMKVIGLKPRYLKIWAIPLFKVSEWSVCMLKLVGFCEGSEIESMLWPFSKSIITAGHTWVRDILLGSLAFTAVIWDCAGGRSRS